MGMTPEEKEKRRTWGWGPNNAPVIGDGWLIGKVEKRLGWFVQVAMFTMGMARCISDKLGPTGWVVAAAEGPSADRPFQDSAPGDNGDSGC